MWADEFSTFYWARPLYLAFLSGKTYAFNSHAVQSLAGFALIALSTTVERSEPYCVTPASLNEAAKITKRTKFNWTCTWDTSNSTREREKGREYLAGGCEPSSWKAAPNNWMNDYHKFGRTDERANKRERDFAIAISTAACLFSLASLYLVYLLELQWRGASVVLKQAREKKWWESLAHTNKMMVCQQ